MTAHARAHRAEPKLSWALVYAFEAHAIAAVLTLGRSASVAPRERRATSLDLVQLDPEGAIVSEGKSEPPARSPRPGPPIRPTKAPGKRKEHGDPPPPAARAGEALTAEKAESSVVRDATPSYVGGVTQEGATSDKPTDDPLARAWGVLGGTGEGGGAGGGGDLTRSARLGGPKYWNCPFPREADAGGIDHAVVRVRAEVLPDGTAVRVETLDDPGYGFAREAIPCAMHEHYVPGTDRYGRPSRAMTAPFRVVFER